jgi:hypothetical protein
MNTTAITSRVRRKRYWIPAALLSAAIAAGIAGSVGDAPEAAPTPAAQAAPAVPQAPAAKVPPAPKPQQKPNPTPRPKPAAPPQPAATPEVDSGRMDEGEWASVLAAAAELVQGSSELGNSLEQAGVLALTGDPDAASTALEQAYAGFADDAETLQRRLEQLALDTAAQCRADVQATVTELETLRQRTAEIIEAASSLDLLGVATSVAPLKASTEALTSQVRGLTAACAPGSAS